jgi:hypothetical protein
MDESREASAHASPPDCFGWCTHHPEAFGPEGAVYHVGLPRSASAYGDDHDPQPLTVRPAYLELPTEEWRDKFRRDLQQPIVEVGISNDRQTLNMTVAQARDFAAAILAAVEEIDTPARPGVR